MMFQPFEPENSIFTPYLFFTGKGGVGKTSTACATAISLADSGKKVLLVSTDPASNLQDVLEIELGNTPIEVASVENLFACNLDPEVAASTYRDKVIGPYRGLLPDSVVATMEEQLSGACTVEIAAFDEFASLLTDSSILEKYEHIIFDTAPTGHTLRLLQLPSAWSGFLADSTHGASCLGPLSGLADKKEMYNKTVEALSEQDKTTLILVSRPDESSLIEANRASIELKAVGIQNQYLIINGLMKTFVPEDKLSVSLYKKQQRMIKQLPENLKQNITYSLPYVSYSLTGVESLRYFLKQYTLVTTESQQHVRESSLSSLHDVMKNVAGKRVIFTMGKGGVGKTTIASAIAVGLVENGQKVHLTTTDPAAHLGHIFGENSGIERLTISRIDPEKVVESYKRDVLLKASQGLDEAGLAYLEEDLNSPCTEEIAVFRAFAEIVESSEDEVVVIDTAPTGHTLLLLDAAQSYHKELARSTGKVPESVQKLLPRLRNPDETSVLIITLAEATPVMEASRLQADLRRAHISPDWWIINQSLRATETTDPILQGRAVAEEPWITKVRHELSNQCAIVPLSNEAKSGKEYVKSFID